DVLRWERGRTLYRDALTFTEVYLALVLLHELGHRQLHRRTVSAFDLHWDVSDRQSMARELAADIFAVRAFLAATPAQTMPLFGTEHFQPMMWLNIDPDTLPGNRQVAYNLAASVRLITDIALRWKSSFGPLYQTRTHPMMVDRAMQIIDAAEKQLLDEQAKS